MGFRGGPQGAHVEFLESPTRGRHSPQTPTPLPVLSRKQDLHLRPTPHPLTLVFSRKSTEASWNGSRSSPSSQGGGELPVFGSVQPKAG